VRRVFNTGDESLRHEVQRTKFIAIQRGDEQRGESQTGKGSKQHCGDGGASRTRMQSTLMSVNYGRVKSRGR